MPTRPARGGRELSDRLRDRAREGLAPTRPARGGRELSPIRYHPRRPFCGAGRSRAAAVKGTTGPDSRSLAPSYRTAGRRG